MTKIHQNHPFHLVSLSPWPILISLSLFNTLIYTIMWFYKFKYMITFLHSIPLIYTIYLPFIVSILCIYQWWRDVTRESTFQGLHTKWVYHGLQLGMILFIISEIFFFISFFWTFFHSSLAPTIEIGQLWPPLGIKPFNPYDIPLMNTIILLSSGLSITWTHHSILNKNFKESLKSLFLTLNLGMYFTFLQMIEYLNSPFSLADSIYGAIFFITTGFHGIHVIIGSSFLTICFYRLYILHFSKIHHFGFEAAAWYWHFVDVIWLFLYISIYWWSY
uniref:Cytochrome c oxidase subunit 3 n=1 Tax=Acropyga goeldii TaxID=602207 RepID=A0A6G5NIS7_9HYME|nr:cytochrome c oxidase subunit III [Acropyga goeldii]QBG38576.1 cytochrome c oxidase subunit III [Acropyga goeldii]